MNKTIHQLWIMTPIPQHAIENVALMKEMNPEWEHTFWEDDRVILEFPEVQKYYDIDAVPAFVSDIVRIKILEKYGGFYIDCDITCLDKLDNIIPKEYKSGLLTAQFTGNDKWVNSGFIYSDKGFSFDDMMDGYLPHTDIMRLLAGFAIKQNACVIPSHLVGFYGTAMKIANKNTFMQHKNFGRRIHTNDDGMLYFGNKIK